MNDLLVTIAAIGNALVIWRQQNKDMQIAFLQEQVKYYRELAKKD